MDEELQAKVNQILNLPLLNRDFRAKIIIAASMLKTPEDRQRFNSILDKMIEDNVWNTTKKGGQEPNMIIQ